MKKSIRFNLFLVFSAIMAVFVAFGILLNIFLLEKYYLFKNKDAFSAIAQNVSLILASEYKVEERFEEIDRAEGISITISDSKYNILYASSSKKGASQRLPKEIEECIETAKINIKQGPIYQTVEKQDALPRLAYIVQLDHHHYMVLTKPLKGLQESAAIANEFYTIAGMLALIVGSLFTFFFSGKITKPIVQMSEIANDIANLDFDRKVQIKNNDELGVLAHSINILSDKLKRSIDGLKEDIEYQKSLSRNMSHELKTPIGVIKGYSEGLLFGVADNEEMKNKYLQVIVSECDRMDGLVKEVLQLSQLSAQHKQLTDITSFSLGSLIDMLMERFAPAMKEQNITCSVEADRSIQIIGNEEMILRAVSNLLSNAIRYNDENRYIRLRATESSEQVSLLIFNTCAPIEEQELAKIFDEFYKIDKIRSRENGGHGLGLSIVKSIAELHKGTVYAKNQKGGIEFIFTLSKKFEDFTEISY